MAGKKQVKRLEVKQQGYSRDSNGYKHALYLDGKRILSNANNGQEEDKYYFSDEINIDENPELLTVKISDFPEKIFIPIHSDWQYNIVLEYMGIDKEEGLFNLEYKFAFRESNKKIKCRFNILWHKMVAELNPFGFNELVYAIEFGEEYVVTNLIKTYTDPTLILGDLIKADVKIIDEVIRRVNK